MKFWHKKSNRILAIVLAVALLLAGSCVWYINDYYHVTDRDGAMSDMTFASAIKTTTGYLVHINFFEYVIKGGNHAWYGDYSVQKGDGTAAISAEEQRDIVTEKILIFAAEQ